MERLFAVNGKGSGADRGGWGDGSGWRDGDNTSCGYVVGRSWSDSWDDGDSESES